MSSLNVIVVIPATFASFLAFSEYCIIVVLLLGQSSLKCLHAIVVGIFCGAAVVLKWDWDLVVQRFPAKREFHTNHKQFNDSSIQFLCSGFFYIFFQFHLFLLFGQK